MKNYGCLLLIILLQGALHAQGSAPGYLSQLTFPMEEVPILGNPYSDEEYRLGEVAFEGEVYRFYFRFNALRDRVELKDASTRLFHLQKNEVIEPTFGGKTYQLKSYYEGDSLRHGYFVPLYKGKITLYLKPKKVFVQAKSPDNGYDSYKPPRYKDASCYYMQFGKYLPIPFELSRKSFRKTFESRYTEVEAYVKRNQLDFKNEQDAIRIVKYYDQLIARD